MKLIKNEDNNLILQLIISGGSLRTTIPADFVRDKKLRDKDILLINKNNIKIGKAKIEVIEGR